MEHRAWRFGSLGFAVIRSLRYAVIYCERWRLEVRAFKLLNIEQQNKEPQNDEVITSKFEIPCSIFCGSKSYNLDEINIDWFSTGF